MEREAYRRAAHPLEYYFFIVLFALVAVISFFVFKPFLGIIFLSIILAVVFNPLYRRILVIFGGHESLSALATLVTVTVLIVAPLVFFGYLLFLEASDLYAFLLTGGASERILGAISGIDSELRHWMPGVAFDLNESFAVEKYVQDGLNWIVTNISWFFAGSIKTFLFVMLTMIGFFHFLKEGKSILADLVKLSPLEDKYDEKILKKVTDAINAVVRGRLAMAAVQGAFAGFGFVVFGIPNPVFFGFLTAFCALIPSVGTALVIVPTVAYLFLAGHTAAAIGLGLWGTIAVGFIDDIIAPYFIKKGVDLHPLLILVSLLGGIEFFGLIGFIAGPVVTALLFVLLDIYVLITKDGSLRSSVEEM